MTQVKKIFRKVGIDRAIAYTILSRFVQAMGAFVVILLIARYLSKEEQGYYYTFGSLAALQVFFELGLSVVITQFVALEFAFLNFTNNSHEVEGPKSHIERLSSLLYFIVKWYSAGACVLLVFVLPAGFIFFNSFNKTNELVFWQLPWVILVVFTALNLLISSYIPYLEGLNKIKEVAQFRMVQSLTGLIALCISLRLHFGLYSLGIVAAVNFFTLFCWMMINKFKPFFLYLWKQRGGKNGISWKREIFPLQWKIALSWLSGYFIFQIFNPIAFAFDGPVVAGQLGVTLAAFNGLSVIAMTWINTKVPTFSIQIAKKEYGDLDKLFFTTLKQSLGIIILIVSAFLIILYLFQSRFPGLMVYGARFLPAKVAIIIGVTTIINQVVFSLATYLRCHKQEPLLIPSLVGAVSILLCSYFFAKWYGVFGMLAVNCINTIVLGLVWVTIIFINKRRAWHQPVFNTSSAGVFQK